MVELLAPAGEYNSMIGAFNAGADAVYLAGDKYGARASAVNFTKEEIINALKYAHLLDRKVYLTVNTLAKQEELEGLYDYLRPLYLAGLDAVLVQDIGVFEFIRNSFPDLEIHVSTQGAVTSPEGALFYKEKGASRIVLARELTLDEIKDVTSTGIETECFVHGAMCYGYSGLCLFSSFLGGNSGNRGRCKGPCRQPYRFEGKEEYVLSLKDMCTANMIDKLIEAGIYSFKIEGRLKSPSYAAGITSVYRKLIDFCLNNPGEDLRISKKDIDLLNNLYSRSGSGTGYYQNTSSKKMITLNGGAYNKVSDEEEKIIYDTYIDNPYKYPVDISFEAIPGGYATLTAHCKKGKDYYASAVGDIVIQKANKLPVNTDDILKNLKKLGNTNFCLSSFEINVGDSFIPSSLVNNLRREAIDDLSSQIDSESKRIDNSINYLTNKSNNKLNLTDNSQMEFSNATIELSKESDIRAFVENEAQFKACIEEEIYDSIVVSLELFDKIKNNTDAFMDFNKALFVEMPPVFRKQNREVFKTIANEVNDNKCFYGVYVNQIDALYYLKSIGFSKQICSNTNIYSYNELAYQVNSELFDSILGPIELDFKNIEKINGRNMYILMYGRAPLMQTANCVLKTNDKCSMYSEYKPNEYIILQDRLKVEFPVRLRCSKELCFNTIYNSLPNSLHKYKIRFDEVGFNKYYFRFTNEKYDEVKLISSYYYSKKKYINGENPPYNYTNGHLRSGIL